MRCDVLEKLFKKRITQISFSARDLIDSIHWRKNLFDKPLLGLPFAQDVE